MRSSKLNIKSNITDLEESIVDSEVANVVGSCRQKHCHAYLTRDLCRIVTRELRSILRELESLEGDGRHWETQKAGVMLERAGVIGSRWESL